jgi:hypothetical protein
VDISATEPEKIKDAAINFVIAQVEYAKITENSWKDFSKGDEVTFGGRRMTISPTQNAHLLLGDEKTLIFYEKGNTTTPPYIWAGTEKAFRRDDVARAPKDKDSSGVPAAGPAANGAPSF